METMDAFLIAYQHHLRAAVGWMELGLPRETLQEIGGLPIAIREHPKVLQLRWSLLSDLEEWSQAFSVAEKWLEKEPRNPGTWVSRAFAARRRPGGSIAEAFALLEPAAAIFPGEAVIPFNLACYQVQLGDLAAAREWWSLALCRGDRDDLLRMALGDADLEPLWPEFRSLPAPSA